jgi:hypothetical protein
MRARRNASIFYQIPGEQANDTREPSLPYISNVILIAKNCTRSPAGIQRRIGVNIMQTL